MKKLLVSILAMFILTAPCFAFGPKKQKAYKLDMTYDTKVNTSFIEHQKYPFKVGVAYINDNRITPFYHNKDNFFTKDTLTALREVIIRELEASGIFGQVMELPVRVEHPVEKMANLKIVRDYDADLLLLVDLNYFNLIRGMSKDEMRIMMREKTSKNLSKGMEMKVKLDAIFQLIYLKKNYVLWADAVSRSNMAFAEKGALKKGELAELVHKTVYESMSDMLKLMYYNGRELKKSRTAL